MKNKKTKKQKKIKKKNTIEEEEWRMEMMGRKREMERGRKEIIYNLLYMF